VGINYPTNSLSNYKLIDIVSFMQCRFNC